MASGDRLTEHAGATQLKTARRTEVPNTIGISDWELNGPTCCEQICLALRCSCWDDTRQYLYVRDNSSIEKNDTNAITSCCTCCCGVRDNVSVMYNDRAPYGPRCRLSPFPLCCLLHSGQPQFRVLQRGYMCFCVKVDCGCRGKHVVVSPFEHLPFPCCCCTNRVSYCDNCCGTCGPISGNSRVFTVFRPQPKDADAFVAAANQVMMRDAVMFTAPGQRSSKAAHGEVLGQRLSKAGPIPLSVILSAAAQGEVLVQLHKASQHDELGLGLIENASGQVVVSHIHPGYVAEKCKALLSADVLLEVNGEPVADLATALELLNVSLGTVELRLERHETEQEQRQRVALAAAALRPESDATRLMSLNDDEMMAELDEMLEAAGPVVEETDEYSETQYSETQYSALVARAQAAPEDAKAAAEVQDIIKAKAAAADAVL